MGKLRQAPTRGGPQRIPRRNSFPTPDQGKPLNPMATARRLGNQDPSPRRFRSQRKEAAQGSPRFRNRDLPSGKTMESAVGPLCLSWLVSAATSLRAGRGEKPVSMQQRMGLVERMACLSQALYRNPIDHSI
ncbi:metal ABC transporter permease [Platysternon megacephalum]|uniref:Metal ABC transporter permease n=1 Tax=Platysternon megacephalum TaxID=55544 RepID=A0A4D9DBC4_9SAUR|nr:metal ABC transporter permease [Platysternon megacephalum]